MLWNVKLIGKLLLTVNIADLKCFILKSKSIIYTRVFIELYNLKNHKQVYEIYRIIELEKIYALIVENPYNFNVY